MLALDKQYDIQQQYFLGIASSMISKDEFLQTLEQTLTNVASYDQNIMQYALTNNKETLAVYSRLKSLKDELLSIIKTKNTAKEFIEQLMISSIECYKHIKTSTNIHNQEWLYIKSMNLFYLAVEYKDNLNTEIELVDILKPKFEYILSSNDKYQKIAYMAAQIFLNITKQEKLEYKLQ